MSNTSDYSDKDILDAVQMMRTSGYSHLELDVQDGCVTKVDVTFKTRTPTQLHRLAMFPRRPKTPGLYGRDSLTPRRLL